MILIKFSEVIYSKDSYVHCMYKHPKIYKAEVRLHAGLGVSGNQVTCFTTQRDRFRKNCFYCVEVKQSDQNCNFLRYLFSLVVVVLYICSNYRRSTVLYFFAAITLMSKYFPFLH
jgi:hypothetical protein